METQRDEAENTTKKASVKHLISSSIRSALWALSTVTLTAAVAQQTPVAPRALKVVIISMFAPEGEPWIAPFQLKEEIAVPGLSPDYPAIKCNADDVCLMVAGMGHANVAASTMALALDPRFDLKKTYFLIAGIAGIDPAQGTTGTATWARYLVDVGIAHEIDARELPKNWKTGYLGLMTKTPGEKPKFEYRTELAQLDEALLQKALALSKGVTLEDNDKARAYRAKYKTTPASLPPQVIQCDTLGGDTWWHGHKLGQHARDWTKLLTDGKGTYCTTQQEDNATYNALERAAKAGKVDLKRLAVLRTASNFDRPYPGQSAYSSLMASTTGASGGFMPATKNLAIVGGALVRDIVARWSEWSVGAPAP
jgi:purine nucleoside permease